MLVSEKQKFDETYNLSYIPPETEVPSNLQICKHYFASLLLYGFAILLFYNHPWYFKLLNYSFFDGTGREFFLFLYLSYILIAPYFLFKYRPKSVWKSKNIAILGYIKRIFTMKKEYPLSVDGVKNELLRMKPTYLESQSLMYYFIKVFFGPLMSVTVFVNGFEIIGNYQSIFVMLKNAILFNTQEINAFFMNKIYWFALSILFFVDTVVFMIGYLSELPLLNNKIRSVETSPFGVLICLACYAPIGSVTFLLLKWYWSFNYLVQNDATSVYTIVLRVLIIALLFIYVMASVALGFRASNLTNRGTVTKWPYSVVRHPAYVSKVSCWWLISIALFVSYFTVQDLNLIVALKKSFFMFLSMLGWTAIYYFRALTEERHLIKDPEYQAYTQKVKYRFIPKVI